MLGLPTPSGSGDGEGGAPSGGAAAAREERQVTTEVVLRLFWSGFGCFIPLDESELLEAQNTLLEAQNTWTKYREKCMKDGRWKMMNFFYYLRNKN